MAEPTSPECLDDRMKAAAAHVYATPKEKKRKRRKRTRAEMETPATEEKKTRQGVCVLLDLVERKDEDDVKTLKSLVQKLGYDLKTLNKEDGDATKINETLKTHVKATDRSAIVIAIDTDSIWSPGEGRHDWVHKYKDVFKDIAQLNGTPKILITHGQYGPIELSLPPPSFECLHVCSQIIGTGATGKKSLFVDVFNQILRKYYTHNDVYDMLTEVKRNMEVSQCMTSESDLYHRVIFRTALSSSYRFTDPGTADVNAINFCQSLTEDERRDLKTRISKYELKKKFSIDVELQETERLNKDHYPFNKNPRGLCIIVNLSNDRPGSLIDEVKMMLLFEELYFDVKIINNKTHKEVKQEVERLAEGIADEHQGVVVFIMGHGTTDNKEHKFWDVKSVLKKSDYILHAFKDQEKLTKKPKIFIIQTCFGEEEMSGITHTSTYASDNPSAATSDSGDEEYITESSAPHKDSDTIQLNATLIDYKSYRSPRDGSFLIQAVDKMFRMYSADEDIPQLMTLIKNEVAKMGKGENKLQQAKTEDTLNYILNLNPGYSVSKQPQLPDTPEKRKDGSVIWQDTANSVYIADSQADTDSVRITHINVDTKQENTVQVHLPVNRVMSGVSVNEICGIIGRDFYGDCKALFETKKNDGLMDSDRLRRLSIDDPVALCSVNNDGIAVLCGQIGSIKATIQVYTSSDIYRGLDKGGSAIDSQPNRKIPLTTCEPFCLGIRDKMCYFKTKFYLSCFHTSMVYQFNIDGQYEHTFGEPASSIGLEAARKLVKPCGIFINDAENDEKLIIACYNGIHQISLKTKKWSLVKPVECGHGLWYNNDKIITIKDSGIGTETEKELPPVPDNGNDRRVTEEGDVIWENTQTSVFVAKGRTIKLMDLGDNGNTTNYSLGEPSVEKNVEKIISGVVIGRSAEYIEHCIVVKRDDGSRRALRVWSEKSVWRAIISVELKDPLLVCSINSSINSNEKIAVLSGKYASAYATIVILKKEDVGQDAKIKSLREISICSTRGMSPPTRPLSLGTRDKMCYYNKHFYISCFNSSTVYQVDIDGKVLQTYSGDKMIGPCAVFAGKRDNTDHITIACANGTIHEGVVTQNVSLSNSQISHKAKGLWYTSEVVVAIQANEEHKFYPAEYQVNAETKVHESATVELKKNRDKVGISHLPGSVIHVTEDILMVFNPAGSQKKPQFTLVQVGNSQGDPKCDTDSLDLPPGDLPEGAYIRSGVMIREYSVNGNKQRVFMFVVGYMNGEKTNGEYRICTVVLKSGIKAMFDFPHVALQAFRIDISKFGVLCYDKNVDTEQRINRVRVYTQDMLESPSDTTPHNMWGYSDHMIDLPGSDGNDYNTITATSDGHLCLGVYRNHNPNPKPDILIYSAGGMCLTTLKISDVMSGPHSLICTEQNNILVVGKGGHVNLYQPNWERITEDKGRGEWVEVRGALVDEEHTCHSVVSGNYMWSVEFVTKDYATKQEEECMYLRAYTIQRPG